MENLNEKPKNTLESKTPYADIVFSDAVNQKFISFKGQDGHVYVASYPGIQFHMKMLMEAIERFKEKGVLIDFHKGGGVLRLVDDTLFIGGRSSQLEDFDKEEVLAVLEKAFPNLKVILE